MSFLYDVYSNLILKILKKYKIVIQSNNNYKSYTSNSTIKGTSLDLSRMYYLMYCKSSGCLLATVNSDYCFHHLFLVFFYEYTSISEKHLKLIHGKNSKISFSNVPSLYPTKFTGRKFVSFGTFNVCNAKSS